MGGAVAYQFFLSYARVQGQSTDVSEFFNDLADAVRAQMARDGGEAGFLDTTMEIGSDWRDTIATALRTCKSMICLLSEQYIDSDYCGREFAALSKRLAGLGIAVETSGLIIPVRWTLFDRKLPAVLGALQNDNRGFPSEYEEHGLQRLRRFNQYHDQYLQSVYKLADTIIATTRTRLIPDAVEILSLRQTPNAFRPGQAVTTDLGPLGPKNAKFVYVAAHPDELPPSRLERSAYNDEGGWWWCPYLPPEQQTIGDVANDAAREVRMRPGDLPTSRELATNLAIAIRNNTPVAIFVDPWTLTLERYDRFVRDVCQLLKDVEGDYGAFVTWNEADTDTAAQQRMLQAQVEVSFTPHRPTEFYFPSIRTLPELRERIIEYLRGARARIMERGPVRQVQAGPALQTLPVPGDPHP